MLKPKSPQTSFFMSGNYLYDRIVPADHLLRKINQMSTFSTVCLAEEILANFNIKEPELQALLATLRHCELVKGRKEGNCVYMVPFDFDE